jgi:hypothetical protein
MREIFIVAGSCILFGGFVGWLLGHTAGFADGREHEKQRAITGAQPKKKHPVI